MLIEELFARGTMIMGPSPRDPSRQVGTFPPGLIPKITSIRSTEMERFRWIAGEWNFENVVPATRLSPAYSDAGAKRFSISEDGWVGMVSQDGRLQRLITFEPFSGQWIYVLTRGAFGMLRSKEGWIENQIIFLGTMTMLGIDCDWRMSWTRVSDNEFYFINEQKLPDGAWFYIDEWRFRRSTATFG